MNFNKIFDVIVIGGGHAGTEAALAAARRGADTLLLTHQVETLGQMSCNPAIGGIGKSHLVKEIDALGGAMAIATDEAGIQFRVLNARKGPAVRATRAQADRVLYKAAIRSRLENQVNLSIFQQAVEDILLEKDKVVGVVTQMGLPIYGKTVVLTAGTFLGGKIHIGRAKFQGGRAGDPPSNALSEKLRALPFRVGRLKTGTPPRIDARSVDLASLPTQPGDTPIPVFSYLGNAAMHPRQIACYVAHTTAKTHQIIRDNLHLSAMYAGEIEGIGPRYCPSIEDKIVRFADREQHQIFIEPEGLTVHELYPNGMSTSLPFEVQVDMIRSMKGFENAHLTRPGYAIEYDYFDPRDLTPYLETKPVQNLFFAGQINGTTGYEEAAAQGIIAGINASLKAENKPLWSPSRMESYIGVLIDDLITCGTTEPYRMFTSRAEYRLSLREDNADLRLTPQGRALGLVDDARWQSFQEKKNLIEQESERLKRTFIHPGTAAAEQINRLSQDPVVREYSAMELLKRPEISYETLMNIEGMGPGLEHESAALQVEIEAKYAGYVKRQSDEIERSSRYEHLEIPVDFDYQQIKGLSTEILQKFAKTRPTTVGQAGRIPGVTPAAISLLLVYLKRKG